MLGVLVGASACGVDESACPACETVDGSAGATPGDGSPTFAAVCEAVTQLRPTASSTSSVSLAWHGAPTVSTSVARKTYCGSDDYEILATLGPGVAAYNDDAVQSSYVYWYAITAYDDRGNVASAVTAVWANTDGTSVGCTGDSPPQPSDVVPAAACSGLDL